MQKRIWISLGFVAVLLAGISTRILCIIFEQPAQVVSSHNRWTVSVATTRGTIYDTNLLPFVNETHEYRAAMIPSERLLSHVSDATSITQFSALREQLAKGIPAAVRLTKAIGFAEGLRLFWVPTRYSERLLAPHTIGYLDADGMHGVVGIEASYDQLLTQYNGYAKATFSVDGKGGLLYGIEPDCVDTTKNSVGGVVLTLDKRLQEIVENVGDAHLPMGAIIVMQPYSGEILALASFPSFQPQTVAQSIAEDNGALLNRAVSLYDCGSVFKIITTAAALENGVTVHETFNCNGYMDVDGTRFHCHNRLGHGKLDMKEAFAQSCNLYYIQLAQEIGAKALLDTAKRFGLDKEIILADAIRTKPALLPESETINASRAALANFSFGQGYLMASPLHFAQIVSSIVNDGVSTNPTLVKGFLDENKQYSAIEKGRGETVLSPETAACLQQMMALTVTDGTGLSAAPEVCSAAGKTGTAETGQVSDGNAVVQSWFVGYFPVESPQYVICVLAEDSTGTNAKATNVFRELANKIYNLN